MPDETPPSPPPPAKPVREPGGVVLAERKSAKTKLTLSRDLITVPAKAGAKPATAVQPPVDPTAGNKAANQ